VSVQITYALFRCYLISLPSLGQTLPGVVCANMKSDFYVKCLSESESSSLPRVGLTRSDVGYMASASGDRNLDAEHLARNRIVKTSDHQFSCALCQQAMRGESELEKHLQSKRHQRNLRNEKWWEDPLSHVPDPHRAFTRRNEEGWPVCTLCHKRMEEKHWTSAKHVQWVNYLLERQQASQDDMDTQPPLPQPPPPPMRDDDAHPPPVAEDGQVDLHPPWGSYGPNGEFLNPEEWEYTVQAHDKKYAGRWWPIHKEWVFFDV
jgi:hypothetical protein